MHLLRSSFPALSGKQGGDGILTRHQTEMVCGILDQALVSGASFLTTLWVGRLCGAGELGSYTLALSAVVLASGLQDALVSIPFILLRLKSTQQPEVYSGNALVQTVAMSLFAFAGVLLVAMLALPFGNHMLLALLPVLLVLIPAAIVRQFVRRWNFATMHAGRALRLDLTILVLQVSGLALLTVSQAFSARMTLAAVAAASGIGAGVWLIFQRRSLRPERRTLLSHVRDNWQVGRWLLGSELLSITSGYSGYWLIYLSLGTVATGVYAACNTTVLLANPFILGVANVFEARAAHAFGVEGVRALCAVVWRGTWLYCGAMGGFAAFAGLLGSQIVEWLFGSGPYLQQHTLITLLALNSFLMAAGMASSCGLRVLGRADLAFSATGIDLGVFLLGAVPFLPLYGMPAVAAAACVGSLAGSSFRVVAFHKISSARTEAELAVVAGEVPTANHPL